GKDSAGDAARKGFRAERVGDAARKGFRAERAGDAARKGFRAERSCLRMHTQSRRHGTRRCGIKKQARKPDGCLAVRF
ncbi:MAG TPA: hypothetical protein PLL20_13040, partial [Phycisphaerae bacterium]|nr:hypothetical protein [Phycisphaerae bacterium]